MVIETNRSPNPELVCPVSAIRWLLLARGYTLTEKEKMDLLLVYLLASNYIRA